MEVVTQVQIQNEVVGASLHANVFGKSKNPAMVWFGLVWFLWHINLYRLFNAKSIFM